ncbi:hypothetical protein GCM10009077_29180 [Roseibium denhamense]
MPRGKQKMHLLDRAAAGDAAADKRNPRLNLGSYQRFCRHRVSKAAWMLLAPLSSVLYGMRARLFRSAANLIE